jgi:hypothetical protein
MHEIKVLGMNLKHQTSGALERIKSKTPNKIDHDRVFF